MKFNIEYRLAVDSDLENIVAFVDFWLRGDGLVDKVPGSACDFFVPVGRHQKYLRKYFVLLALLDNSIIGWAVKTNRGVLIHLLVAGTFRSAGIGSEMLKRMDPESIRSKMDQTAGNPAEFYAKAGYTPSPNPHQGKKHNIELFVKETTR